MTALETVDRSNILQQFPVLQQQYYLLSQISAAPLPLISFTKKPNWTCFRFDLAHRRCHWVDFLSSKAYNEHNL